MYQIVLTGKNISDPTARKSTCSYCILRVRLECCINSTEIVLKLSGHILSNMITAVNKNNPNFKPHVFMPLRLQLNTEYNQYPMQRLKPYRNIVKVLEVVTSTGKDSDSDPTLKLVG